eukprot:TRINITY_DN1063_c0_g2_i1.p1 TRINITY_DN1063_c0_g2~~TRINITY_DN1063_c0_g2_i1.p1  ORF type:complete len:207 (+),score=75.63 TRINITY_DN1063_c0_g2_i1:79-699(+)
MPRTSKQRKNRRRRQLRRMAPYVKKGQMETDDIEESLETREIGEEDMEDEDRKVLHMDVTETRSYGHGSVGDSESDDEVAPAEMEEGEDEDGYTIRGDLTKGAVVQKHKEEWRKVKRKIAELQAIQKRLSKTNPKEKAKRREIGRKVRKLVQQSQKSKEEDLQSLEVSLGISDDLTGIVKEMDVSHGISLREDDMDELIGDSLTLS